MLNGLDPIIIFNFKKKIDPNLVGPQQQTLLQKIPLVADIVDATDLPPVPIYLSEKITGLFIDSEDKNIDLNTTTETLNSGDDPLVNQKGISSTVKVSMQASRKSLGVTLMAAMADQIFKKASSKEYTVTYLHGAVTVFNGLINSFSITQNADDDRYQINLELTRSGANTQPKSPVTVVSKLSNAEVL